MSSSRNRPRSEETAPAPAPAPAAGERDEDIARLQAGLARVGLDPGPIDGALGERTQGATRALQSRLGLPQDGHWSAAVSAGLSRALQSAALQDHLWAVARRERAASWYQDLARERALEHGQVAALSLEERAASWLAAARHTVAASRLLARAADLRAAAGALADGPEPPVWELRVRALQSRERARAAAKAACALFERAAERAVSPRDALLHARALDGAAEASALVVSTEFDALPPA